MENVKVSTFAQRLAEAMKIREVSQTELHERTGINKSSISTYLKGGYEARQNKVYEIARALNVSEPWLMGYDVPMTRVSPAATRKKGVKIPVLGYVAAGIPFEAIENVIDEEEIDEVLASKGDFFGLVIHGESMEPEICDGDTVIVRKQETCDSGQIAIVLVNGDDATCKIVHRQFDGILLEGINRDVYTPTFYNNEAIESLPVQVIGVVAEVRRKYQI